MRTLPFITALCPTYRRPELLANSLWLWNMQTYPADRRQLVILDDGYTFDAQTSELPTNVLWRLFRTPTRFDSITAKYDCLIDLAPDHTDAFLIWEDDDIYLPYYIQAHANVLKDNEYSKPKQVMSDYPGYLILEESAGRFFSSIGFRKSLYERIGGMEQTKRADFDQRFLARIASFNPSYGNPWPSATKNSCQFVYGWHTGKPHGQNTMRSPDDETWWDNAPKLFEDPGFIGQLVPKPMQKTLDIFEELGYL